ncbi:MAG: manganese efflux pump MntP family protein [Defluviitaleaceae bacterium]|nr:manganese efflux pump MntP family protein [Defluviitaleaceae bacterium]
MGLTEIFFTAAALSTDAFAVAICVGLSSKKFMIKNAIAVGLYFGIFQAVMPLIGYLIASLFAGGGALEYGHWIAFVLLCFLGGKMIFGSLKKGEGDECITSIKPAQIIPLAVATSIDALAVGISFAFLQVDIVTAALLIGIITFMLSAIGVKLGSIFGAKFKSKAEFLGGIVLILIGFHILFENLGLF